MKVEIVRLSLSEYRGSIEGSPTPPCAGAEFYGWDQFGKAAWTLDFDPSRLAEFVTEHEAIVILKRDPEETGIPGVEFTVEIYDTYRE